MTIFYRQFEQSSQPLPLMDDEILQHMTAKVMETHRETFRNFRTFHDLHYHQFDHDCFAAPYYFYDEILDQVQEPESAGDSSSHHLQQQKNAITLAHTSTQPENIEKSTPRKRIVVIALQRIGNFFYNRKG